MPTCCVRARSLGLCIRARANRRSQLHYFEGSTMENIQRKGRIRLAEATALQRLKPDDRKDFTFVIKVPGRDWTLDPGSASLYEEWEGKLRPMIGD